MQLSDCFNSFMPDQFSHIYQLNKSFSILGALGGTCIFHLYANLNRSTSAFCGVWSGSALFLYVLHKGHKNSRLIWFNPLDIRNP